MSFQKSVSAITDTFPNEPLALMESKKRPDAQTKYSFLGVFFPKKLKNMFQEILGSSLISMSTVLSNPLAQRVVCVHPSLGKISMKIENMLMKLVE